MNPYEKTFRDRGFGFMSESDNEEIKFLEREYQESLSQYFRNNKHTYYAKVGSIIGIVFIVVSSIFNDEFYKFFGTFGMLMLNGVSGMCIIFTIISLLPSYKDEEKFKWHVLETQRKKLEKLKKNK